MQKRLEDLSNEYDKKDSAMKASFFLEDQGEAEKFIVSLKAENKDLKESNKRMDEFMKSLLSNSFQLLFLKQWSYFQIVERKKL